METQSNSNNAPLLFRILLIAIVVIGILSLVIYGIKNFGVQRYSIPSIQQERTLIESGQGGQAIPQLTQVLQTNTNPYVTSALQLNLGLAYLQTDPQQGIALLKEVSLSTTSTSTLSRAAATEAII